MELYKELLEFSKQRIEEFFKNTTLFETQFQFTTFNADCYDNMYQNNKQENIKTVKQLKNDIVGLKDVCKECASYYMNPRNKSKLKYDLIMGQLFENILIDFLNDKLNIKALHADDSNKQYPDCMVLKKDRGIAAYFEVKYHSAPFICAINKIKRYCYEGSVTLDYKKIIKQLEVIESDIERPVFYLHWIDYPCLKGIFFETSEQVKDYIFQKGQEFTREEREGDLEKNPQSIYLGKFYSPLLQMGTFEEFIGILKGML